MQNKLLIKIFFLFCFFINLTSVNSSEQFNFDVTKIEITEDGNRFTGLNRGKISTSDGLIIKADNFDYYKNTNILKARGNIIIYDELKEVWIYSEKLTYLKNEGKIFTEKNSKAVHKNYEITANRFSYNEITNVIKADDNVKSFDNLKNIILYSESATYLINENKIFTENKSKLIDQGLIITANKFYYNQVLNILKAEQKVTIKDSLKDVLILSDDITYFKNDDKIKTIGSTKALIESKYNFLSSDVLFLRKTQELISSSKTQIINENKESYELDGFTYSIEEKFLKGLNVKVTSDIKVNEAEADHLKFKNGFFNLAKKTHQASETEIFLKKKSFGNSENDPRLYGVSSKSSKNKTIINKGIFTSCKINNKCPAWSVKAEKITHDKEKKQLIYDNAFLRVYDYPVMYFPKFFHPDPTVNRQSGFLRPQINNSEILGSSIFLPYFKVISENKDFTFKPTIFDSDIYMLQNEYRQKNKNSFFIADIGLTKGYKSSLEGSNKNSMSHIFAKFDMDLNLETYDNSKLKFFGEKVSNDTYLKIFDNNLIETANKPSDFNSLNSGFNLHLENNDYAFNSGVEIFENLQTTKNSDRFQFIFPYYNYSTNLMSEKNIGGIVSFSSQGSNRLLNTNNLKTEIGNSISYNSFDKILDNGIKNNFNFYLKNTNKIAKNDNKIKNSAQLELASILEVQTSLPLIKKDKYYVNTIEPKLSFRLNPSDMNNYSDESRRINSDNIFNIDRLGLGEYESGKSLTLGLNYKKEKIDDINKYFEFKLATVLRDVEEERIPLNSTINRRASNLFGSLTYKMMDTITLDHEFSIDNDFNTFEYNSIGAYFDNEKIFTKLNFVEENGEIGNANSLESELGYTFDDNNYLKFKTRRNRTLGLTEYYDLVYEYKNDCLTAGFKYKKSYYQDRDLKPKEDLLFSVTFFPLSTFEQKIDQDIYRN